MDANSSFLKQEVSCTDAAIGHFDDQHKDLREILAAFAANAILSKYAATTIGLGEKQKSSLCVYHGIMKRFEMEEEFWAFRATFQLCVLRRCLQRSSIVHAAIPVEKTVAIALWRLGPT